MAPFAPQVQNDCSAALKFQCLGSEPMIHPRKIVNFNMSDYAKLTHDLEIVQAS